MMNRDRRKAWMLALSAMASPIVALTSTLVYQSVVYPDVWNSPPGGTPAVALGGLAVILSVIIATAIGACVGFVLSLTSIRIQVQPFGILSLIFNSVIVVGFTLLYIRACNSGW